LSRIRQFFYERMYRNVDRPEKLVWHTDVMPELLQRHLDAVNAPLRVLDVGCGAGILAVKLAEHGHDVTAIDIVPKAVELARQRARSRGVAIRFLVGSALDWVSDEPFDLVFDRGCLHNFQLRDRERYKKQLLSWLCQNGDYVLEHFAPLFPLDWRPIGPCRRRPARVRSLFEPEFVEVDRREHVDSAPLPIGPRVRLVSYRFRRAAAEPMSAPSEP
jgi:SAM-dependent methyltransferase